METSTIGFSIRDEDQARLDRLTERRGTPYRVEGGHADMPCKLPRASVKADLQMSKILNRLDLPDVSDDEVDMAMDEA